MNSNKFKNKSLMFFLSVKKYKILLLCFIPILLYIILIRIVPVLYSWIAAFKYTTVGTAIFDAPWVGMANFIEVFSDSDIVRAIFNTVEISMLRLIVGFFPPIILAILLFDLTAHRFRKISQTLIYLPHFFSWVIISGIVFALFSTGTGLINNVLSFLGFGRQEFLLNVKAFRPLLVGSALWKEIGWSTILYLASLAAIDTQIYEAAAIDGCGPIRKIINITLPNIMPIVTFVLCISIGNILNAGGEQILLFYNDAVATKAETIETWVYFYGLSEMEFSIGIAVGVFQSVIGFILIILANTASKKFANRSIW